MIAQQGHQYYVYRYLLIAESQQMHIGERRKDELMPGFVELLRNARKLGSIRRNRRYLLIYVNKPRSDLLIGKLARERRYIKMDEGIDDVEPITDQEFPFVTFVIDLTRQLVLIQRKPSVFEKPKYARSALEHLIASHGQFGRYRLALIEVNDEQRFWDRVEEAESIYRLDVTLQGPNFFEDLWTGDDIAKKVFEAYGSTETTVRFNNPRGGIRVIRDVFSDLIRVISAGGGRYFMIYKQKGEKYFRTVSSKLGLRTVWLKGEDRDIDAHQLEEELAGVGVDLKHVDRPDNND